MQTLCRIAALAAALVLAPAAAAQSVYKWVDEDGVTHYAQHPPDTGDAQLIDPENAAPPPSEPEAPETESAESGADETDSADSELPSSMSEYCDQMRQRVDTLAGDAALQIRQDDGNLQELSDEQRAERLERARSQIDQHCGDESS